MGGAMRWNRLGNRRKQTKRARSRRSLSRHAQTVRRPERLDDRILLAGDFILLGGLQPPVYGPAAPIAVGDSTGSGSANGSGFSEFQFQDSSRWSRTATDGSGLIQGDATTVTWSIVPDGTGVNGFNGEASQPSDLVNFLEGIYGVVTNDGDFTDEDWFSPFQQYMDRWTELSGLTFVYEPNDDGAALDNSLPAGQLGVRGDIRISGHFIDGENGSNTLAYNFFPNTGDMVIDTANPNFYGNLSNNSLNLRNTLAHETGHGIGLSHVCPVMASVDGRLMEPFINSRIDGPQLDDILATHRGYGDVLEKGGGNDDVVTATDLGTLQVDTSVIRGQDGRETRVSPNEVDFLTIDDDSDVDVFRFTVVENATLSAVVTPVGTDYLSGPQNADGSCSAGTLFEPSRQSDLTLELIDTDGATVLRSIDAGGVGDAENLAEEVLTPGDYFVRIGGKANAAQLYELQLIAEPGTQLAVIASDGETSVSEGGLTDTYVIEAVTDPNGSVTVRATAPEGVLISTVGETPAASIDVTFTASSSVQIFVEAIDDSVPESTLEASITHEIVASDDPVNFPLTAKVQSLPVTVFDNDLNEFVLQRPQAAAVLASEANEFFVTPAAATSLDVRPGIGTAITVIATPSDAAASLTLQIDGETPVTAPPGEVVRLHRDSAIADQSVVTVSTDLAGEVMVEVWLGSDREPGDVTASLPLLPIESATGAVRWAVSGRFEPIVGSTPVWIQTNDLAAFVDVSGFGTALSLADDESTSVVSNIGNDLFPSGTISISNNGVITEGSVGGVPFGNESLPSAAFGRAVVPFWDDIWDNSGEVYFAETQVDGVDALIVQWDGVQHFNSGDPVTFQAQILDDDRTYFRFVYPDVDFANPQWNQGASATVGYQTSQQFADPFSFNQAVLSDGDVLSYELDITADVDEYLIDLTAAAGQTLDVLLSGRPELVDATLQLTDLTGQTVFATGVANPDVPLGGAAADAENFELGILDFEVPANDLYVLRVTSDRPGDYRLVASTDVVFGREPDGPALARELPIDLSSLVPADVIAAGFVDDTLDPTDTWSVPVTADQAFALSLSLPSGGQNVDFGDAEIQIELLDAATLLASATASIENGVVMSNAAINVLPEADGNFQLRVTAIEGQTPYSLSSRSTIVNAFEVSINAGQDTRSRVDEVEVEFAGLVDIDTPADAFEIVAEATQQAVPIDVTVSEVDGQTVATIQILDTGNDPNVDSAGSLVDGDYQLRIVAPEVRSSGLAIDGDGDGASGGDFVFGDDADEFFFRKYGDANGDTLVDLLDFGAFRGTFGETVGDAAFREDLDVNADGEVDLLDFGAFRSNFGT